MHHTQRFLVAYVLTKAAAQQPDINPTGAALLGGFTGPIGPAIYGGAEGGVGTGARMAGRTLLEGLGGGLLGGAVGTALSLPAALSRNRAFAVNATNQLAGHFTRLGVGLGAAHGAYASARNANKRKLKKKASVSPGVAAALAALDPSGVAPALYGGITGKHGHPGWRMFGRSAAEGLGGAAAGGAAGAGLGAGTAGALALLLSRGKIPAEELAVTAGIGGGLGAGAGSMAGGFAGHVHGNVAAARNYNARAQAIEHPVLSKFRQWYQGQHKAN